MCRRCESLIEKAKTEEVRERQTALQLNGFLSSLLGVEIPPPVESKPPTPTHARWAEELGRTIVEVSVASHVLEDIVLGKACSSVFGDDFKIPPTRTEGRLKMLEHVQNHLRAAIDRLNTVIGIQIRWVTETKIKAREEKKDQYPHYKGTTSEAGIGAQVHVNLSGGLGKSPVDEVIDEVAQRIKTDDDEPSF